MELREQKHITLKRLETKTDSGKIPSYFVSELAWLEWQKPYLVKNLVLKDYGDDASEAHLGIYAR